MAIIDWLKGLEKGGPWQLIGITLALVGIALPFLLEKNPVLTLDVLSNTSVVDIREEVDELQILYRQTNIKKEHKSLSIVTLKVHYEGNDRILLNYYDTNDPFGISISDGQIVSKPEIIAASNDYLLEKAQAFVTSPALLMLPQVILEADEYYVLKLLILHNKDVQPEIRPKGKVAGVKKINVLYAYKKRAEPPFWTTAFSGGINTQIARTILYGIFIFGGLILSIIPVLRMNRKNFGQWRQSIINEFRKSLDGHISTRLEFLSNSYVRYGWQFLNHINIVLSNKSKMKHILMNTAYSEVLLRDMDVNYKLGGFYEPFVRPHVEIISEESFPAIVHLLSKKKIISLRRGRLSIDKKAVSALQLLLNFLEKQKAAPKDKHNM